ncbi:MAG: lysylphosphatidylglycerol synthase transmembrane domain-containing protein [Candidatus Omnitrophota bacterium]
MGTFKKIMAIFLRIAISIFILIFLFRQVDRKTLFELIKNADKMLLFFAFIVYFGNYLLGLFRWEMLLKAVKIHLSMKRIIMSFSGGIFFSLFLPSTIGGDFIRTVDLAAHTKKPKEVVATVFLDRLSGYIGLVLLSLLAVIFGWRFVQDRAVLLSVAVITLILCSVLLVLFNSFIYSKINKFLHTPNAGKIKEIIRNLHQEIHYFRNHKKIIIYNIIISIFIQSISPIVFYLIGLALGVKINIMYYFIFLPIIGAITLLPVSIGGLGLRDATTIYFFSKACVSKDLAFAMSLLNFSFILVYGALGGLIYVFTVRHRRLQHHKSPSVRQRRS